MAYVLKFHPEAEKEFLELDYGVKTRVAKQLLKIASHPELGESLGNKNGIDLSGFQKMYAEKKRIRIVYEVIEDEILIRIIAIGQRDDMAVYKTALKRLREEYFYGEDIELIFEGLV
ncbi:MAG: type II toxin-antitoxin system RelE family toxin [Sulfuricurvum sp.]